MNIIADLHTHTVASTHAYSTVYEMTYAAKEKGLQILAVTDHAIGTADAPDIAHFYNMVVLPDYENGVRLLKGVEANIIELDGKLDMPEDCLKQMDIVIASYHSAAIKAGTSEQNTNAYIGALKNPHVHILGHCGCADFSVDYKKVLAAAKEYGKVIEINNSTFTVRKSSIKNCYEAAKICKENNIPICVNSDAHYRGKVGEFGDAIQMLKEISFPENLILNTDASKVLEYLKLKK